MDRPNHESPPPSSLKITVEGRVYVIVDAKDKSRVLSENKDPKTFEGFVFTSEPKKSHTESVTKILTDLYTPSEPRKSQTELNSHGDNSSLEPGAKTSESKNPNTVKSKLGDDYVVVTPSQSPTTTSLKDGGSLTLASSKDGGSR